jgi:hypothetical protein
MTDSPCHNHPFTNAAFEQHQTRLLVAAAGLGKDVFQTSSVSASTVDWPHAVVRRGGALCGCCDCCTCDDGCATAEQAQKMVAGW